MIECHGAAFMSVQPLANASQAAPGAGDRVLTGNEIAEKFMENAELVISRQAAEAIRAIVLRIEQHDVRELGRLLAGR
jgi:hypothetical protein